MNISKAIKFTGDANCIQSCFRLPVYNKTPSQSKRQRNPSIIVKFWGPSAKQDFFKQYMNTKNLCLTMLGFTTPSRIYVNENLTKKNFNIFCAARQLKDDGKIFRYNTFNGRVFIKLSLDSKQIGVDNKEHLNTLVNSTAAANK